MTRPMAQEEDIPLDPSTLIRLGRVSEVTFNPPRCRVRFSDPDDDDDDAGDGGESPPIRWLAARAGKTKDWSPPSLGEEAVLLCPDGQIGNGVALVGLFNDENPPPGNSPTEVTEYEDGARVTYDPVAHGLSAILPAGGTALVDAPGGLTIRGPVTIEGDVTVSGTVEAGGDVTAEGISLTGHRHSGVQIGTDQTGPAK
ncbi:phage baseplate assembly protein V [Novosphingobium sp. SL115]|uniref:phage baseplate assembly protein V n=1 Tax=Novosphingobium sp. SL115 TaxID=2995150 RepID=UPI0022751184|nr:phage baseplate assembly protein V [Novosphingobium sp. SL115]MCY1672124.1 phage baseplate assembly protein V [Novosphingobium sp. SL115]